MSITESKRPGETNLRLDYESARGVVTRVAEIGRPKPMDNIARPDSKMPGAPQIKTCTASHLELAVDPEIIVGYPRTVEPPTNATMGDKAAGA